MSDGRSILYEYIDELLRAQSKAATMFEHHGVLGAVREDFLVQQITERVDHPLIHTGEVYANGLSQGQTDIILRKRNTLNPRLGNQSRLNAKDCAAIIEVKSTATATDIRDFNAKAQQVKADNPDVQCGFFCYSLACKKSYILKKLGYRYDLEYLAFEEDDSIKVEFPFIDFIVCFDDRLEEVIRQGAPYSYNKFFFTRKKVGSSLRFDLYITPPFSFHFLNQMRIASNVTAVTHE